MIGCGEIARSTITDVMWLLISDLGGDAMGAPVASNGDGKMSYPELDRMTLDPGKMGGKPCIRGIRITVGTMTGLLAAGESIDSVLGQLLAK